MTTVAKLKKDGSLNLINDIDERLPAITNGLVAYYPLDSQAGAVDVISGNVTVQNLENEINILDALEKSWRDPANWGGYGVWDETEQAMRFDSYAWYTLNINIPIDTSKHWYIEATMKQGAGAGGGMYLGTISYDANLNILPGHPGTYDYFGNAGASVPTYWQTYNNDIIGGVNGNGRTGESTNTGDYTVWHTGTKYVKILIITNYNNQPGPTWVKNLKFYHKDTNTSNAIVTDDGIAIQATTNLVPNPTIFSSGWSPYVNGWDGSFMTEFGTEGANIINRQSWCGLVKSIIAPAGTYTLSAYVKLIGRTNTNIVVSLYTSGGGISDTAVYADWSKQGEWQRIEMTRTFTSANFTLYLICFGGANDPAYKVTCQYTMPQIELRSFSTAFVDGSNSTGYLTIPTQGIIGINGSVSLDFWMYQYTASYTHLIDNGYYNGQWFFVGFIAGSNVMYTHEPNSSAAYVSSVVPSLNAWHSMVVTWDNSYQYLYLDGVYLGSVASTGQAHIDKISYIRLLYPANAQEYGRIKNLAIYNKALSATEIKELVGEGFKLTTTNAITPFLIESPVIPLDAYYFPLGSDTKDSSKTIDATYNTNVVFDGGAWVGTATTNLFSSSNDFSTGDWAKSVYVPNPNLIIFTGGQYICQPKGVYANGNVYTISWKMSGFVDNQKIRISLEGSADGGHPLVTLSKNMKTYYRNGTANGTGNFNPLLYQFNGDNINDVSTIRLLNAQLEQKIFPSPYVNGSRGASLLKYNLNNTIGLDWSANWTICYWKKPMATYTDNLTGYNIESLGGNGATNYLWWGKENR